MFDRGGFDPGQSKSQQLARAVAMLASSPVYLDQIGNPRAQVLDDIAWAVRALTRSVRKHAARISASQDPQRDERDDEVDHD